MNRRGEMNRRFGLERRFNSSDVSFFTLFVDNLPYDVGLMWFRSFFSNFGLVKRSFIPNKVSRRSGCRFGFVSFGNREEADLAIAKSNGIWIDNRKLLVKKASFSLNPNPHLTQNPIPQPLQSKPLIHSKPCFFNPQPSEPPFFSNPQPQHTSKPNTFAEKRITIKVQPIASSWLSNCSVVKLKNPSTPEMIVKALQMADWFAYFKPWNGEPASLSRFVWLKCSGVPIQAWNASTFRRIGESWGDFINLDEETMKELSYDIGRMLITTEYERSIDEWINILINGRIYRVRVWEEPCDDPFAVIFKTQVNIGVQTGASIDSVINSQDNNNNSSYGADLEGVKDPHTAKEEAVNKDPPADVESKYGAQVDLKTDEEEISNSLVDGPISINKAAIARDSMSSPLGIENYSEGSDKIHDSLEESSKESQSQLKKNCRLVYQESELMVNNPLVANGSAMDSISSSLEKDSSVVGSEKVLESVMVIDEAKFQDPGEESDKENENNLEEVHFNHNVNTNDGVTFDPFVDNHVPIQTAVKGLQGKKKRKTINEILGFSKVNTGNSKGRRSKNKCVVLRSAIAAAALSASMSSDGINNRNKILLDEARTIWEINKMHGIGYDGDEEEIISKIAEMEAQNKERVDGQH